MAMPADQLPVGEGLLPDGSWGMFYVSRPEMIRLRDNGPQEKYEDARFLEEAVRDPDAIFLGLRRPNQDDALCYSVFLTCDPEEDDEDYKKPPRYGLAFLAFVRVANMGCVIFDWEWREEDPDLPGHPNNWRRDFGERLWSRP
ncbi:hypothetical protein GobsT_31130 [Gemmata obscuriglobus]|uniref:Uncharacterized protein n=1 Tax=Gemmata obscuriglobus TaxID=114 RepID=A0A2Z3GZ29_9BACT|nr:hypothetical protein [Gemmata obscuriglobus]AWM38698.1 hypothetical protein C1280_18025 [Gemmata obscuriglobus]QEG28336.1 hypothetical protein GobsT_31130 [Gemmata obscuriglobus]VTS06209.1 unnamed protein product [Gemmata obscuriglobus UQM 2246]